MQYTIRPAVPSDASVIASLVMLAMSEDCCSVLAAPRSVSELHSLFVELVRRDDTLYSYRNTFVAVDEADKVLGCVVSYDGAKLGQLKVAVSSLSVERLGHDITSMMGEETAAGEFYIDSLAVLPDYQHKGIATSLLRHVISVKRSTTPLGLLVDVGNPKAEALYTSLGFRFCDFNTWGGHKMKHLVLPKLV